MERELVIASLCAAMLALAYEPASATLKLRLLTSRQRVEARLAHREEQYLALLYGPARK
jgi:hypothetical protein